MYALYIHNTHVKFRVNWMLFIIWSINLFLCIILAYKNLKFEHLLNAIIIDFLFSRDFARMKNIIKKCYPPLVNFSKITSNKNILNRVITNSYNQFYSQIFSFLLLPFFFLCDLALDHQAIKITTCLSWCNKFE